MQLDEGKLRLDPRLWRVDAWRFEELCIRLEAPSPAAPDPAFSPAELFARGLGLYRGHFLASDAEHSWAISYRERLPSRFLRLVTQAGHHHEQAGEWGQAKRYYQLGLEVDELAEGLYQCLMLCCRELGQLAETVTAYRRCRSVLAAVGLKPTAKTVELYHRLTATL